ncbi:MAG: TetR/AcrR family transcriptional regulator [Promethearchaeota archaeon]
MEKKIKRRAKAPEKKAKKFEEIINTGKEMLRKHGTKGLSIRAIAKKLGMAQTNLYNYVKSKRELWIAIRSSYYNEYLHPLDGIIKNHKGSYPELFYKISKFFLDFASIDYHRFEIMFLISAPKSTTKGPFEKVYEPFQITKRILELIKKGVNETGVEPGEILKSFYHDLSLLIGAAKMEADLRDHFEIKDPFEIKSYINSPLDFRQYILERIKKNLENYEIK